MDMQLIPHIKRLGYGGLLPFVGLLTLLLLIDNKHHWHPYAVDFLRFYSAIIVTFVGALNWGLGLSAEGYSLGQRQTLLTYSVIPSLLAWLLLGLNPSTALIGFALLYLACYGIDSRLTLHRFPKEYAEMRRRLSFSVAGVLILCSQLV